MDTNCDVSGGTDEGEVHGFVRCLLFVVRCFVSCADVSPDFISVSHPEFISGGKSSEF
jgi:hypothetical protein